MLELGRDFGSRDGRVKWGVFGFPSILRTSTKKPNVFLYPLIQLIQLSLVL